MRLTSNFTLDELIKSSTATSLGIDNYPNTQSIENLRALCQNVLQPVRDWAKRPVLINSGFRSLALNRSVKSSLTSDHLYGKAADIEVPSISNLNLAIWIRDNLKFKQLILEFHEIKDPSSGWVHVSYDVNANRQECLTAVRKNGKKVYISGLR